jgi:hypothetical protein
MMKVIEGLNPDKDYLVGQQRPKEGVQSENNYG